MMLRCGTQIIDLTQPVVMGVLNVTPDSFSDGGKFLDIAAAVAHGLRMVEEGAAIIDVGGESTRPGADPVSVEAEIRRVIPVVEQLRAKTNAVISVDTSKPQVIRAAAEAGAGLINDVRALSEEGALEAAAGTQCAVCVMHMQRDPRSMQLAPHYADVVNEVKAFLAKRVTACRAAGIAADRIVIDPGFGFGKTLEHNLELLRYLRELVSLRHFDECGQLAARLRKRVKDTRNILRGELKLSSRQSQPEDFVDFASLDFGERHLQAGIERPILVIFSPFKHGLVATDGVLIQFWFAVSRRDRFSQHFCSTEGQ